jgi:hypothetical protein
VNGYSGFFPRSYDVLRRGLAIRDPQMFDAVASFGTVVVAVDARSDRGGEWARQIVARPGTMALGQEGGRKLFALAGGTLPAEFRSASRLRIESASANVQSERIALAMDGDEETRWDSGPQRGTEVVTIDLGSRRTVDGVSMTIGPHLSDFPRLLAIESSEDGVAWSDRWKGNTAVIAFAGAVRHPREVPLAFPLPAVAARFLRLRQLGQDPVFYWSIFELAVFGH